ncbi:hypothetical protein AB3S75_006797 [Citrus x aurantiifolia]
MSTNKERIERVEAEIGSLQDGMKRMELGLTDRLHRLEETTSKLVDSLSTSKGTPSHNNSVHAGSSQPSHGDSEGSHHQLASRLTKLECPRYSGDDPTEWYNRIMQFFEYQEATNDQKSLLSFFSPRRRGQQMVVVDATNLSRRGKDSNVRNFCGGGLGTVWPY